MDEPTTHNRKDEILTRIVNIEKELEVSRAEYKAKSESFSELEVQKETIRKAYDEIKL